jgi:predicted small secreted protein
MRKKNVLVVSGMPAAVLALGFAFAGCDTTTGGGEPYNGPKTIKITGYNKAGGVTVPDDGQLSVYTAYPFGEENRIARDSSPEFNGQTITYTMVNEEDHSNNPTPWTGTGKFYIEIECRPPKADQSKTGSKYVYSVDGKNPTPVNIKNAVTTLEWAKFIWLKDYKGG